MRRHALLILILISFLTACNSGDSDPEYITKEEAMLRGMLMFKDAEDKITLYSDERKFKWGEMLGADILSINDGFMKWHIRNFIPQDIDNVSVLLKANSLKNPILIAHFETMPMHYLLLSYLPFDNTSIFKSVHGEEIFITDKILKDPTLKLIIESDDKTFNFSRTIKKTTQFSFFLSGNFKQYTINVTPEFARYYTMLLLNFGYIIFSSEFETQLINLLKVCTLKTNDNRSILADTLLQQIRAEHQGGIKLGILDVNKSGYVVGFASPSQLNLRDDFMAKVMSDNYDGLIWAITHEWGHILGYGHESNMTYENGECGFTPLMKKTYNALRERGELPIKISPF